jgi:hypothetical protein
MFGRAHDVPLGLYANNPFGGLIESSQENPPYIGNISCGVYLGKKLPPEGGGSYTGFAGEFRPEIVGWLEHDEDVNSIYPEYTMPSGIPEWVNAYNPSTHGEPYWQNEKRFLIGDGTNSLGPFTLQDALYIYSVLKTYAVDGYTEITNSAIEYEENYEEIPLNLFRPKYKGVGDDIGTSTNFEGFYSSYTIGNGSGEMFIVADVDDLSKYYISGDTFLNLFSWRGGHDGGGNFYVEMDLSKQAIEFDGVTLSEVGDSHTKIHNEGEPSEYTETVTYIETTVNYTFGPVSGTSKLYGFKTSYDGYDPTGGGSSFDPPYPSSLSVSGIEFWPYENADGLAVYSESAGSIVNDPIP